ncbi:hypothetical protein Tco_0859214 [Tanacetum coccineum]|uniref:Uncharacterized protein n=1 Tax=Tanacetum coccineum TaxID=301880 RepID=A0ABQ5BEB8_9ASTR
MKKPKTDNKDNEIPVKETPPLIKENSSLIRQINSHFEKPFEIVSKLQHMKTLEQPLLYPKIVVLGDSNTYVMSVVNQLIGTQIPGTSSLVVPLILKLEKDPLDDPKSYYVISYDTVDNQHEETKFTENLSEELRKAAQTMLNHKFLMTNHCQGDCVYLNVTSAGKDLNLQKSTKVLAEFDQSGKRTVSVVAYDDNCSEDSLLRFTSIIHTKKPLGYVLIILKAGVSTDIDEGSSLYDYVKAECYGYGPTTFATIPRDKSGVSRATCRWG